MTAIVGMALGKRAVPSETPSKDTTTANFLLPGSVGKSGADSETAKNIAAQPAVQVEVSSSIVGSLFSKKTRAIIWGLQTRAVQGMMDFDYVCGREQPSVACMVYPISPGVTRKFLCQFIKTWLMLWLLFLKSML